MNLKKERQGAHRCMYTALTTDQAFEIFLLLPRHRCDSGNLNGHYYNGPYQAMTDDGVVWYTWHGWWYSIKSVVMMVRAADLEHPPPVITPLPGQLDSNKAADAIDLPHGR